MTSDDNLRLGLLHISEQLRRFSEGLLERAERLQNVAPGALPGQFEPADAQHRGQNSPPFAAETASGG